MKTFYMVMRLSRSSEDVQQVDSLPHKKYATYTEAWRESNRLCFAAPNAAGFVVLKCVGGCLNKPSVEVVAFTVEGGA